MDQYLLMNPKYWVIFYNLYKNFLNFPFMINKGICLLIMNINKMLKIFLIWDGNILNQ